jgi:hypothetical protein
VSLGRALSFPCYPICLPYALFSRCELTHANCKWWRGAFACIGLVAGGAGHAWAWRRWSSSSPLSTRSVLSHLAIFLTVDHPQMWLTFLAHQLMKIVSVERQEHRLNVGKLHGSRVIVVGNGPSALEGEPMGDSIDKFDEVVRFNNFQTKTAGFEKFVGTKTTVHFSDGVLYPTYQEYNAPGADVMLSLFTDRFIIAGSYIALRGACDLQTSLTLSFMNDPTTGWITKAAIERLKQLLGLKGIKHPTSGMLAIDHFLNMPGVELPVYIHGFDFFMGPKIHYFNDHEPLYERVNNRIGVNMHSPRHEKVYVEKLIAEGKVRFLKDLR